MSIASAAAAPASIPMYGIKSTSLVNAADLVAAFPASTAVTAVPPVLPAVLVILYYRPTTFWWREWGGLGKSND